jgi:hypothetical protein
LRVTIQPLMAIVLPLGVIGESFIQGKPDIGSLAEPTKPAKRK